MILYHYTDRNGYNGIMRASEILPSRDTALDAAGGPGAYFTDFTPDTCQSQILSICLGRRSVKVIDHYVCMDIPKQYLQKHKDHIYLVPDNFKTAFPIVDHGQKPRCPREPCDTCPQNTQEVRNSVAPLLEVFGIVLGIAAVIGTGILIAEILNKMFGPK